MLQHNIASHRHAGLGDRAHIAHAAMLALHTLCCGLPVLAMLAVAASGAASGFVMFAAATSRVHAILHGHETLILAASAAFVLLGGGLELAARQGPAGKKGVPWLFLLSIACFFFNLSILVLHRSL